MKAKEQLEKRHEAATKELWIIAKPLMKGRKATHVCEPVAKNLGISTQTVIKYIHGLSKDGFLTEALIQQFKSLKL